MIDEYEAIKPLFDAASYTPIGFGKPINERLAEHPDGKKWLRRVAMSGWEIIRDNFEDDHCRCFMMWMAFQTVTPPEWPMTGRLAYSLVYGPPALELVRAEGRLGRILRKSLVRLVEEHGGVILTDKMVQALIVENGRCVGVECADGSAYRADKAVLSTIHIKHLVEMAPRQAWADEFVDGRRDLAGRADPIRHALRHQRADDGSRSRAARIEPIACRASCRRRRGRLRMGYDFARGAVNIEEPVLLAVCPTLGDPGRAPPGKHTVKMIGIQPYDLHEGPRHWDEIKEQVAQANLNWLRKFSPTT